MDTSEGVGECIPVASNGLDNLTLGEVIAVDQPEVKDTPVPITELDTTNDLDENIDASFAENVPTGIAAEGQPSDTFNEDDEDDIVNVIIKTTNKNGVYKTGTTYQARSQPVVGQGAKIVRQGVNLNDPGDIQGVPTIEFNYSSLGEDDKPWKRPGSDITDYFNYGFAEDTWMQYCEKQKILRQEYANTALKPVILGTAAGLGLSGLSSGGHRGAPRYTHHHSYNNRDINVIGSHLRSHSVSDEDGVDDKRDGILVRGQAFNVPPPGYGPPAVGDAFSQLSNVAAAAAAFTLPPPGFTNTSVPPPPVLGSNFSGNQWPQGNVNSGLISLLSGPPVRSGGRSHMMDNRRDRTPENLFSDDERNEPGRSRYRVDGEQEDRYSDRYERDHRSQRRSRSRSRDRHHVGRNRRHREDSPSREYPSRHGDRSSRRRDVSRDRGNRRKDRSSERDQSVAPPDNDSAALAQNIAVTVSSNSGQRSRGVGANGSGERSDRRRGDRDRDSKSSHHRRRSNESHRKRSSVKPEPNSEETSATACVVTSVDPLVAVSVAAADINERIRRGSVSAEHANELA